MSTLIMAFAITMLTLAVAYKLPGINLIVMPIIQAIFKLLQVFVGSFWGWAVMAMKTLARDHAIIAKNLVSRRSTIFPSEHIKMLNRRGGHH